MATETTYDVASNLGSAAMDREDLSDTIHLISPEERPISSTAAQKTTTNRLYEFGFDTLRLPKFDGFIETDDVSAFANQHANLNRTGNRIQGFDDSWSISKPAAASEAAGLATKIGDAQSKITRQVMIDAEAAIGSDNDHATNDADTAGLLRGLGNIISNTAPTNTPTWDSQYVTPSASLDNTVSGSLTEAIFNNVLQSVYEETGNQGAEFRLVAGPNLVDQIAEQFTRASDATLRVTQDAASGELNRVVDIYRGSFGRVMIEPSMFVGRTSGTDHNDTARNRGYLFPAGLHAMVSLVPFGIHDLETNRGGFRGYADWWVTFEHGNPRSYGKFHASS